MPLATRDDLQAIAALGGGARHNELSVRGLERRADEYLAHRPKALAAFALESENDVRFPTLVHALGDSSCQPESLDFVLVDPPAPGPAWEFLRPFRALRLRSDGSATIEAPDGTRERAMARVLLREHFRPHPGEMDDSASGPVEPRPDLFEYPEFFRFVRETGTVPFALALALYRSDERLRVEFDLLDNGLIPDRRAGRLSAAQRVRRSTRQGHAVDAVVARGDLSLPTARVFEVLAETHGLTVVDLLHVFGGGREMVSSALETLAARRLVKSDPRTGVFRARLETTVPVRTPGAAAIPGESPLPPFVSPNLRSGVVELLSAAEARTECPLCGDPFTPTSPRQLVCAKCAQLVAADASPT